MLNELSVPDSLRNWLNIILNRNTWSFKLNINIWSFNNRHIQILDIKQYKF